MYQYLGKTDNPDFFCLNFPKNGFCSRNSKNLSWIQNQHLQDIMCANFQVKQTALTFLAQICLQMDLGFEFEKTNVETKIIILEIPSRAYSRHWGHGCISLGVHFLKKRHIVCFHFLNRCHFLSFSNENIFLKIQGTRLGAIVARNKGLE